MCHIYIYMPYINLQPPMSDVFSFQQNFPSEKKPAPMPGGEPLLLFLGPFISQAEKNTACMVELYIYIHIHIYIYIYIYMKHSKKKVALPMYV